MQVDEAKIVEKPPSVPPPVQPPTEYNVAPSKTKDRDDPKGLQSKSQDPVLAGDNSKVNLLLILFMFIRICYPFHLLAFTHVNFVSLEALVLIP